METIEEPTRRRWGMDALRLSVTIAALVIVVRQVTWDDSLRLPDGTVVRGYVKREADHRVLVDAGGRRYEIPPSPEDRTVADPLTRGFFTLVKHVKVGYLIAATLMLPVVYVLTAWRWQLLLRTHKLDPGLPEAVRLTWVGILMNNVLPGSSGGDLVKAVCISRRTPGKRTAAVMTVFIDRVLGLISLMLVGATATIIQGSKPEFEDAARIVRFILIAILLGGMAYFSGRLRRLFRFSEIMRRLPFHDRIKKVDDSVFHYRSHTAMMAKCVGISLLTHFWAVLQVYLIGRALGIKVALLNYFVFLPVIFTVGAVLPSIGGLGVLEGGFQRAFSAVGATPASAVAMCLLYRMTTIVASLPGLVPAYRETRLKSEGLAQTVVSTGDTHEIAAP